MKPRRGAIMIAPRTRKDDTMGKATPSSLPAKLLLICFTILFIPGSIAVLLRHGLSPYTATPQACDIYTWLVAPKQNNHLKRSRPSAAFPNACSTHEGHHTTRTGKRMSHT